MYKYEPYKPPAKTYVNNMKEIQGKQEQKIEDYEAAFKEAVNLHRLGIDGDKEAVGKACELLKKLHSQDPKDHLVEAYLGSATALLGRDLLNPMDRMKTAIKGLKMLNHAVSQQPDNCEIRFLRANVCSRLPEMFFHRTDTAIEDFSYLISRYEEDNSLLSRDNYWRILFDLGTAYKTLNRLEDAHAAWQKLLSVTTDDRYTQMVRNAELQTPQRPSVSSKRDADKAESPKVTVQDV